MLNLKNGHEVSYKTFLVPNFGFAGFFLSFGHNPSLYDVPKPKSGIFVIFVKKSTIEFELYRHWEPEFSFQIFKTYTHKNPQILSV